MSFIYDLADSWNSAGTTFTAIKMNVTNTASAAGSKVMDLQIGGSSLFILDKAGNVGIGVTPSYKLDVYATGNISGQFKTSGSINALFLGDAGTTAGALYIGTVGNDFRVVTGSNEQMRITSAGNVGIGTSSPVSNAGYGGLSLNGSSGSIISMMQGGAETFRVTNATGYSFVNTTGATPLLLGTSSTERMRIDAAGNVGIGTSSPLAKLNIESGDVLLRGGKYVVGPTAGGNGAGAIRSSLNGVLGSLIFQTENASAALADVMTLDGYGNLGLGVTPSAATAKQVEIGFPGNVVASLAYGEIAIANASTYNSGWKYAVSGVAASMYRTVSGAHVWSTAPSGTAGNAITFTQAMTLDASGNLGLGTTSPGTKLHVNAGNIRLTPTVDGSNGVLQIYDTAASTLLQVYSDGSRANIAVAQNKPLLFYTNNTEQVRITGAGDVGIGTSSPGAKLDVYGGASGVLTNVAVGNAATAFVVGVDGSNNCQLRTAQNVSMHFYTNAAERMRITGAGNLQLGTASLATTATNGFPYIPTCAGTPTGTPTAITGYAPMVVDSTNNKLYVYVGGAWQAMN